MDKHGFYRGMVFVISPKISKLVISYLEVLQYVLCLATELPLKYIVTATGAQHVISNTNKTVKFAFLLSQRLEKNTCYFKIIITVKRGKLVYDLKFLLL